MISSAVDSFQYYEILPSIGAKFCDEFHKKNNCIEIMDDQA